MKLSRIEKKKQNIRWAAQEKQSEFVSWLTKGKRINAISRSYDHQITRKLVLSDKTEISVQASGFHYCEPRKTLPYSEYTEFEIGFPTRVFGCLKQYAESSEDYTETVYPYVPKRVVAYVVELCGGVIGLKGGNIYKLMKLRRNGKICYQRVKTGTL